MIARALTLFTLLLASACGYGPSPELACSDYAQAFCDVHQRCTGGTYYPRTFADRATCVRRIELGCTSSYAASGSERRPLEAEACVRALADPTFSCADLQSGTFPASCRPPGTRPNGAPCGADAQCQTNVCVGLKTAACGVCGPAPTPGASCATSECAAGQICQQPEQACEVPILSGAACVLGGPLCAYGLVCPGSAKNPNSTCVATDAMLGDSCLTNHCAGQLGLACNSSSHVCQPLELAGDGAPCGPLGDGTSAVCLGGGSCYLPGNGGLVTNGAAGTCKQAATDGAACDTMLGPSCVTPARCVLASSASTAGTCTLPDSAACD